MKHFRFTKEMLCEEAAQLQSKRFAPGPDGMTAEEAVVWMEVNGAHLCRELNAGKYRPAPAQVFGKAKAGGGFRRLAKLSAVDTVIQRVLYREVGALCEKFFSPHSHAYRAGRGVASALRDFCEQGRPFHFAAVIDPVDCFDNIDRERLADVLVERLPETFLPLLNAYAAIPLCEGGRLFTPEKGLPQGAPLSDLLCNLYFDPLDRFLTERGVPFVRYADDLALFADSAADLRERYDAAVSFLTERLALTPHPRKCAQGAPEQLLFLGRRFRRDRFGLTAYDPARERPVRGDWQEEELFDPHRRRDILSDGCLRRESGALLLETAEVTREIPVAAIDNLCIHSDVTFDVGVLKCAAENGVMISVMDQENGLIGRFMPNTPLRSPVVTREQLAAYYEPGHRVALAKEFVLAAIHNLRLVIRYYHKMNPHTACQKALTAINTAEKKIKECADVEELLVLEAGVHAAYFGLFDHFLENTEFRFEKRSRRPPRNEVNAMISFCDTVLYHLAATEIYASPLDIRVGFLHASNRRQESLNLDIAESFRPLVVDRTVLTLLNLRAIRREHFDYQEDRVFLNREGKRIVLQALYRRLNVSVAANRNEHPTYEAAIREDVRKLARHFKTGEAFHAFHQVR